MPGRQALRVLEREQEIAADRPSDPFYR